MVLIAYQPKDFQTLCDVLSTQLDDDSPFRNSPARNEHFDEFRAAPEAELGKKDRDEWIEITLSARIPVSQTNSINEALMESPGGI